VPRRLCRDTKSTSGESHKVRLPRSMVPGFRITFLTPKVNLALRIKRATAWWQFHKKTMSRKIANVDIDGARGQVVVILLAALNELRYDPPKEDVLTEIQQRAWLDLRPEDKQPYPSQPRGEARWRTLVAWARKDCVQNDLMPRGGRNVWSLTDHGRDKLLDVKCAFGTGILDVRKCFLWAPLFKRRMCPSWEPSENDAPRPAYLYNDLTPPWMSSTRGNEVSRHIESLVRDDPVKRQRLEDLFRDHDVYGGARKRRP
jgi:hypothetical protein